MATDLLAFIPPDAARIVEVGSGIGENGESYRKINPFACYTNVELDGRTIQPADFGFMEQQPVDCLLDQNVLEKQEMPLALLKKYAACLTEQGQLVIVLSNPWSFTALTQWLAASGSGSRLAPDLSTDSLPRHAWTLDDMVKSVTQAGLFVYDVQASVLESDKAADDVQQLMGELVQRLGMDQEKFIKQAAISHYILRVCKQPVTQRLLLQTVLGEELVCARVRIHEPHRFCATVPGVQVESSAGTVKLHAKRPGEGKVFIWQRKMMRDFSDQLELIRRGYLVIYEMDDDPLRWPELYYQNDFLAFRSSHAVQVSTESLAAYVRQFNPHVAVFPNQIAYLPPPRVYEENRPFTVFFGALNREEDYRDILPEFNRFLHEYGNRVRVNVVYDRKFFDSLETVYKQFEPFCPFERYQQLLYQSDLAILPLQDNRFNRMKSDLKFLECAACGVAVLASPTVYADTIQDHKTGLIYRNPEEFGKYLRQLADDFAGRTQMAVEAYDWVKKHRLLSRHYRDRLQWYTELGAQYSKLTTEIFQQMKQ